MHLCKTAACHNAQCHVELIKTSLVPFNSKEIHWESLEPFATLLLLEKTNSNLKPTFYLDLNFNL